MKHPHNIFLLAALALTLAATTGCASSSSRTARREEDENYLGPRRTRVTTGSNFGRDATVAGNNADTPSRTSVYSREDLRRADSENVSDSLRRLDPSISANGQIH